MAEYPDSEKNLNPTKQALNEVKVMMRYALETGLAMEPPLRERAQWLLTQETKPESARDSGYDFARSLVDVHDALAKVVAPATPRTLEATEPHGFWGSFGPPLLRVMLLIAIISIVGFVFTSVWAAHLEKRKEQKPIPLGVYPGVEEPGLLEAGFVPTLHLSDEAAAVNPIALGVPADSPLWLKQLNWFFAAALGAVFYVLFIAVEYVRKRTYDPIYNSWYVLRFVLGLVAGLILANVIAASSLGNIAAAQDLGPAVAALLGGFSTEAVYQILQRLVEVLVAAVRGDNAEALKTEAMQTAEAVSARAIQTVKKELFALASDPTLPAAAQQQVYATLQKIC